ncbi:longevity assurance proteins LAG1/LAC1 [Mycena crocata]|nr:longevity assurance proteins LAG1/LAC1 [Mycena crocata]
MASVDTVNPFLRWAVSPRHALYILLAPPLLALPAQFLLPLVPEHLRPTTNPFLACFLLSHKAAPGEPERPEAAVTRADWGGQLYIKGPGDLALLAWTIVLVSLVRLLLSNYVFSAFARRWGITKEGKLLRFGEQGYTVMYSGIFGAWGVYIMSTSRTWWYQTEYFWCDYPHNHLSGAMKRYYLCQIAFWLQQFLVLVLGLEKRRSDHNQFIIHHCVTVWMVSWSYLMNVTLLGTAVYVCMDLSDMVLAASKMLNYLSLERSKVVGLGILIIVWTYFRHYLSLRIIYSVFFEFKQIPKHAQIFSPSQGLYMAPWMRDQMGGALCVLQLLNAYWYFLILRIAYRGIMTRETNDSRSDSEDEEDEPVMPVEPVRPVAVESPHLKHAKLKNAKEQEKAKNAKGAAARVGASANGLSNGGEMRRRS